MSPLERTGGRPEERWVLVVATLFVAVMRRVSRRCLGALLVAPVLAFLSYLIGPRPMDLLFTTFEVVAIALSVGIMALISPDGESNWMEGVQLVYAILGIAFYYLPS
jgi:calcium/proton exchanger cax